MNGFEKQRMKVMRLVVAEHCGENRETSVYSCKLCLLSCCVRITTWCASAYSCRATNTLQQL